MEEALDLSFDRLLMMMNRHISHIMVLLAHRFATSSLPQLRHLSHLGARFSFSLLILVHVLCYQPSCNSCLHLAIVFKNGDCQDFASGLETDGNCSQTDFFLIMTVSLLTNLYTMQTHFLSNCHVFC